MEQKSVYEHERIHMAYGMVTMEDHRVVSDHRTIRDGKVPLEVLKGNEEGVKMILVVGDKQHNRVEYYDLNVRGWERAGDYKFSGHEKNTNAVFGTLQSCSFTVIFTFLVELLKLKKPVKRMILLDAWK